MQLSKDQDQAVSDIYEYGQRYLVGEMGSGKTAVAITAACELLRDKIVKRVLVVAPIKVCQTVWPAELAKWSSLSCDICIGTPAKRLNALRCSGEFLVVNFENLAWLLDQDHGCDMLVIDEVTKMKAGGVAFKRLRKDLGKFEVRLVMTGTPVSENFQGLFYPMMIVDKGASLGRNKRKFLSTYFELDYNGFDWHLVRQRELLLAFADQLTVLPNYTDSLPELTVEHVKVPLNNTAMAYYKQMARDMVNEDVTANNAAVLANKLQQIACGFVYDDNGQTVQVHHQKDSFYTPTNDRKILVYQFEEEKRRAYVRYPMAYSLDQLNTFKHDDGGVLIMHSKSGGHGLDLTCANHMIFLSPVWSSDLMRQTIARIWRRGQTRECLVEVLVGEDTIEEEIVKREHDKRKWHEVLMSHLK